MAARKRWPGRQIRMSGDVTDLFFFSHFSLLLYMTAFFVGLGIGAVISLIGAALSYWFGLHRTDGETRAPLAYLVLMVMGLGLVGILVTVRAFVTGQVGAALLTGAGVVVGFNVVFGLLLLLYIRADNE
ncbi:MAG: hypothetical protein R3A10_23635 [Caldilineaceae bacterium]|nr:hypothetical protein [Caldilineaceae bacterium]